MSNKKDEAEAQKTQRYRYGYRRHTPRMPPWTPFGYLPKGYPPLNPLPYPQINPEDELRILEREKQLIQHDLDRIEKRIREIKKEIKEEK